MNLLNCQHPYSKNTVIKIEDSLSTIMAIVQALQYVIDHKQEFQKEYSCESCFNQIQQTQESLGKIIQESTEHYTKEHSN